MIRIGITGQAGFIGTHIWNTFGLFKEEFERIPFEDSFFDTPEKLETFAAHCDVIIHLAALNRHNDPDTIYRVNLELVDKLTAALEKTGKTPFVLFSSSTQEERDNVYGRSKREGRERLIRWAEKNGAPFAGLVIPNVFGPFGNPYYNSVVATFCHQLTHGETPQIDVDGQLKLIYVSELAGIVLRLVRDYASGKIAGAQTLHLPHTAEIKVSEILTLLERYRENYFVSGIIPKLENAFERNLFNTFRCYMPVASHFPVKLKLNSDPRGTFVEVIKLADGGQVSFSTTLPGITRGNHFHTRKIERFAVIKGKALIQLRRIGTDEVLDFHLDGNEPAFVDMPVWYTHNLVNTGEEELYTIFWINEPYDPADPDTFFETV